MRKEAELKESSSKARLKGTEQAKKAHLARLQARKAELKMLALIPLVITEENVSHQESILHFSQHQENNWDGH